MNREEIIRMAREAGATPYTNRHYPDRPTHTFNPEQLERFAALVAAAAIKDAPDYKMGYADGVAAEREACHALRQTLPNPYEHCQVSAHAYDMAIAAYGAAIRARSQA